MNSQGLPFSARNGEMYARLTDFKPRTPTPLWGKVSTHKWGWDGGEDHGESIGLAKITWGGKEKIPKKFNTPHKHADATDTHADTDPHVHVDIHANTHADTQICT